MITMLLLGSILLAGGMFAAVLQSVDATAAGVVNLITTAETLICVGGACAVETPNVKVSIKGFAVVSPGIGTTVLQFHIIRGNALGGAVVGIVANQGGDFTVGQGAGFTVVATDTLQNAGQAQYCMSVIQVSATNNGQVAYSLLETMVLSG